MTAAKLLAVAAVGLSAAACSYSNTTTQAAPATATVYPSTSQQACVDYGFRPGTDSYNRCVAREAEARARGRVPVTYTVVALQTDAQGACTSYGLAPGSATYERCVSRELDARRYRQDTTVTTYTTPGPVTTTSTYAPNPYTTVYTTTTPTTTVVPAATTPPAGVQAFRDEFGFRYDGQGNRIDARGNIISPQATSP